MMHELDAYDESLVTVAEMALWLRVSVDTIRRWAIRGTLPALRVGGRIMFHRQTVLAWLRARADAPVGRPHARGAATHLQLVPR
jgi:excisionase family DNA binding protein